MPITFEAPAPIGAVSRVQQNTGPSLAEQYAAEMHARSQADAQNAQLQQNDRQFQDHLQEQRFQFAAQNAFSPRDQGMAQAAQAQQQQRFQLQADLNQTEMTQAENMRLQRLKQGEDSVKQQLTEDAITPDEAKQMLTQLRTGINPLEMKKAAMQVKHQDMQNQQMQSQIERTSRMEKEVAEFHAKALPDRITFVPDPNMVADVMAEFADNQQFQMMPPERQKALINHTVRKRGGLVGMYEAEPGKFVPLPGRAAAAAGKPEVAMHESGVTSEQYAKHYQQAHDMAMKEQARQTDDGVTKKYVNPQGIEWLEERTQQHLNKFLPQTKGQGQQGPKAEPKPFDTATMAGADETQKVQVSAMLKTADRIRAMPNLDENEKSRLVGDVAAMRNLFAKYGSPQALERKANGGDKQAKEDWALWQHCNKRIDQLAPLPPEEHPAIKAKNAAMQRLLGAFKPDTGPTDAEIESAIPRSVLDKE